MAKVDKKSSKVQSNEHIPPVVTVLGHVDHGKTTLLDVIRKTSIAEREHGGITQRIGASSIEIEHEGKKRFITFIDTPGHEAFKLMRGRGLQAADIALLVVSSVDGVMPQTKESIELLQASKTPFIVVLTMTDLAAKNIEKVKGQLKKEGVSLEGAGGDVPFIEVSAKEKKNIKELLDLILLVRDVNPSASSGLQPASSGLQPEASAERQALSEFKGIVIESKLDPKAGPKATIVVKGGRLALRDEVLTDSIKCKVRSIINTFGKMVDFASQGEAVEVLGFEKVPAVGSVVYRAGRLPALQDDARQTTTDKQSLSRSLSESLPSSSEEMPAGTAPAFNSLASGQPSVSPDSLNVILVADTQGSLEAIEGSISEKVNIVFSKTGDVEASDVLFTKSTGGIILGFNAKVKSEVQKLAENEKVLVRNYTLIYELLSEVEDFLEGKKEALAEKILGRAQVIASFPYDKQKVLGVKVLEGRIAKGDRVRIVRDLPAGRQGKEENIIGESTISSLRQGKEQVSKVEAGQEAGVLLASFLDFQLGDVLVSHA